MPLFEFKCYKCSNQVEKLQKHDDPAPKCDKCNDRPLMVRQVSRTSFALKGSGWAFDGYGGP